MKYIVTKKAVEEGVFDEEGEINFVATVPGYKDIMISKGYIEEKK